MSNPQSNQEKMLNTIKKHEKLVELAKKMNTLGKITEILFLTLSDLILPEDRLLLCYYQLQTSERMSEGQNSPQFYSSELNIITGRSFIHAGFFQSMHTVDVKSIDHISSLTFNNLFGNPFDVDAEVSSTNFETSQLKVNMEFCNSAQQKVASWDLDTTDTNNINLLLPQIKNLVKYTGIPLAKVQF